MYQIPDDAGPDQQGYNKYDVHLILTQEFKHSSLNSLLKVDFLSAQRGHAHSEATQTTS